MGAIFLPLVVLALGGASKRYGPDTDKELIGIILFALVLVAIFSRGKKD